MNWQARIITAMALWTVAGIGVAAGKKGYRCEKKEGKDWVEVPDVKSRKDCKSKGGKWVKEHSHEGGGEHDHEHDDD